MDFVRDNPGEPVPEETFTHSPIVVINRPLSASYIYDLSQVSKFSLVYLLASHPISSPNHCILFATHAHTIAFAVVPRLSHLILVSLGDNYQ